MMKEKNKKIKKRVKSPPLLCCTSNPPQTVPGLHTQTERATHRLRAAVVSHVFIFVTHGTVLEKVEFKSKNIKWDSPSPYKVGAKVSRGLFAQPSLCG